MVHSVFTNSDVVLQIVKDSFAQEYKVDERQYRMDYLLHIRKLSMICRSWYEILVPQIRSHIVLSISREPKRTVFQTLTARGLSFLGTSSQPTNTGRVTAEVDGSTITCRTNIAEAVARGVGRVRWLVVSLEANMNPMHTSLCLHKSGFCRQPWPRIRDLCIQVVSGPDDVPQNPDLNSVELISQAVFEHAPFVQGFYVSKSERGLGDCALPIDRTLGEQAQWIRRIQLCGSVWGIGVWAIDNLSALSMAVGSNIRSDLVPVLASRTLQTLELSNVEPPALSIMLGDGSVVFESLRALKLTFRTHMVSTEVHDMVNDHAVLQFPRLESVHIYGYMQLAPWPLLQAIERAPVRHLDIDMTIQNMRQLDITRIPKLSTLRLSLAHSANVQPLLDPVFASSVCLQRVIFDMRAPGECELPQTMRLKNLRCLKLGSLIRMEQLRPLIQQLPRLVELEIAVNHEPRHEILIMIDEAQRIVREQSDSTSVSLQVLGASCRRDICVSDMVSRLGAELVALLGSIKSVRRFRCRDNSRKVYDMLDRILRDPEVALVAGHLRELDVC